MKIPRAVWLKYKNALAAVDRKAAADMEAYIKSLGDIDEIPWQAVEYAFALTDVYGEAAGAAACEMYEAVAQTSGVKVPPAEMASLPELREVAKVVKGAFKNGSEMVVPGAVGRMVKQVGADTMLKNAQRDGAEFAWVPAGDTCPFCLMLASRGWQRISKAALKNGHAEHIHAHCDCTYAVRFDGKTTVEGYEPEKYREMYDNAEGDTPEEKLRSMRRAAAVKNDEPNKESSGQLDRLEVTQEYLKNKTSGKGKIIIEPGYRRDKSHKEEIYMAEWIRNNIGGDIVVLKEINEMHVRTPDFLWDGYYWDLKTVSTEKASNSAVRSGLHQIFSTEEPGGIILDYGDHDIDLDYAIQLISKRVGITLPHGQTTDIIIITKGRLYKIFRYKK